MSKPIDIPNSRYEENVASCGVQNYVIFDKEKVEEEEVKYYKIVKSFKNLGLSKSLPTYSSSPSANLNSLICHHQTNRVENSSSNIYSKSADTNCLIDYMSIYMDTSSDSDKDNKDDKEDIYYYDDNFRFPCKVFQNVAKRLLEE